MKEKNKQHDDECEKCNYRLVPYISCESFAKRFLFSQMCNLIASFHEICTCMLLLIYV